MRYRSKASIMKDREQILVLSNTAHRTSPHTLVRANESIDEIAKIALEEARRLEKFKAAQRDAGRTANPDVIRAAT